MSDAAAAAAKPLGRPMKFPYTFSAKLAQFPAKFYFKNNWVYRFYVFSIIACIPVFYKINTLANSPENQAKWAETKKKQAEGH